MGELVILGGGLAGLSAAYHSTGVVYEKEKVLGGHGKSHSIDGFIFDEGIHVVHTNDKEVLDLYKKIGVEFLVRDREAWICSFGAMTRYPFQANTYGLPVSIVKDCLLGFMQNDFTDREKIRNYEDCLYYMFGRGIADHFMIPYAEKFWGVHPRELMTDWVDVRHPRPSIDEVIDGALHDQKKGFGVNATFRYPVRGGFGAIGEAFAKKIDNRLHLGMEATEVDPEAKTVTFSTSERVSYGQLVTTIPLPRLIQLIPDAPKNVRDAASRLRATSILVVNIGVDRSNISDKHWIYYLEKEYPFFRISFTKNFNPNVIPKGKSAIQAEVAYNRETNPLTISHEAMAQKVMESLKKCKVLREDDRILFTYTFDIPYAYIIHDKNRIPSVTIIHDYLRPYNIYPCGRYGDWGYLWSHDAVMSGRDTVFALQKGKEPHPSGGLCSDEQCGCEGAFDK